MSAACVASRSHSSRRCAASSWCAAVGAGVDATARSRNDCAEPSAAPPPGSAVTAVARVVAGVAGAPARPPVAGVRELRTPERYRSNTARPCATAASRSSIPACYRLRGDVEEECKRRFGAELRTGR